MESAQKALEQIEREEYEADIRAHGVNEIIKVGIAFAGKKVEIKSNLDSEQLLSREEEIAQGMLEKGLNMDMIVELTKLSREEVESLRED